MQKKRILTINYPPASHFFQPYPGGFNLREKKKVFTKNNYFLESQGWKKPDKDFLFCAHKKKRKSGFWALIKCYDFYKGECYIGEPYIGRRREGVKNVTFKVHYLVQTLLVYSKWGRNSRNLAEYFFIAVYFL